MVRRHFCAILLRSIRRIRPFPGRSTHLNWIARSAQASESRIVQAGLAILAIRERGAYLGEAASQFTALAQRIAQRVGRFLQRRWRADEDLWCRCSRHLQK